MNEKHITEELQRLQQLARAGYEVKVRWMPGVIRRHRGRQLDEAVIGDTIFIYAKDQEKALMLVRHGFAEWLLNQHTKPYKQLINKLIALFEEQQYENKEKIVEVISRLFSQITTQRKSRLVVVKRL